MYDFENAHRPERSTVDWESVLLAELEETLDLPEVEEIDFEVEEN